MSDSWKVASVPFVIWRRMGRTPGSEDCEEREGELALSWYAFLTTTPRRR